MPNPRKWFNSQRESAINRVMNVEEAATFDGFSHILGKENVIFSPTHAANKKTSDLLIRTPEGKHVLIKTNHDLNEKKTLRILNSYGKCNNRFEKPARLVLITTTPVNENVRGMIDEYNRNGKEKITQIQKEIERVNAKIESEQRVILSEEQREKLMGQWKDLQYLVNIKKNGVKEKAESKEIQDYFDSLKKSLAEVQSKLLSDNNARKRHESLGVKRCKLNESLESSYFHEATIAPSAQLGNLLAYKLRSEKDSAEKQRLMGVAKNTLKGSFHTDIKLLAEDEKPKYPTERLTQDIFEFLDNKKSSFQYEPLTSDNKTPDFMVTGENEENSKKVSMVMEVKKKLKDKRAYEKIEGKYETAKYNGVEPNLLTIVSYTPVSASLKEKNWIDMHRSMMDKKTPVVILDPIELKRAIKSKVDHTWRRMKAGEISREKFSEIESKGKQLLGLIEKESNAKKEKK